MRPIPGLIANGVTIQQAAEKRKEFLQGEYAWNATGKQVRNSKKNKEY
jgi:hypothetical protein